MKTDSLTSEQQKILNNLINQSLLVPYKEVEFYPRYWDSNETKMKWKTTSLDIKPYLKSLSDIFWNLDTEELNIFRSSNLTLQLDNSSRTFEEDFEESLLYESYLKNSLIKVKAGYVTPDGTKLLLYTFSGMVDDYKFTEDRKILTLSILSLISYLDALSAENLPDNQITGENVGTGDGSTKDFYTSNKGVGRVKKVYVAGVEQKIAEDYSISQLNDKNNYAKISFVTAPSSGAITCDYTYWYQDKSFKYLVDKLLDSGEITERLVEDVLFDNFIWNNQIWDSQAEFDVCSKYGIETLVEGSVRQIISEWLETTTAHFNAGVIKDNIDTSNNEIKLLDKVLDETNICYNRSTSGDFSDSSKAVDNNNNTFAYRTIVVGGQGTHYLYITLSEAIELGKIEVRFYRYHSSWKTLAEPGEEWKFRVSLQYYNGSWHTIGYKDVYALGPDGTNPANYNTWIETFSNLSHSNVSKIRLEVKTPYSYEFFDFQNRIVEIRAWKNKWTTGHFRSQEKTLGGNSSFGKFYESKLLGQTYTFKVRKYSDDAWSDWVIVTDENKIDLAPGDKTQYDVVLTSNDEITNPKVYDNKIEYIGEGYSWNNRIVSQNIDCSIDLQQFGNLENWLILLGKEIKLYTQSAPDDGGIPGTWEEEIEISGTNKILSTCIPGTTQWLKWTVRYRTDDGTIRPLLQKIKANWATTTFVISLANFSGLTVKGAIEELANMPNYECGFDAIGKYFFRSKEISEEIDLELNWKTNLEKINEVNPGLSWVRNHIEASFGDYSKIMDVKLEEEDRPDSMDKYGYKPLMISGRNLLGNEGVNIATGIAMRYYGKFDDAGNLISFNLSIPKQRISCVLQFIPQLDLSDTVEIICKPNENPLWENKKYKVIGIKLNLNAWKTELNLLEI